MDMPDITAVLDEEQVDYKLDSHLPKYLVHLYDDELPTGVSIEGSFEDSFRWEIVTAQGALYLPNLETLRTWIVMNKE